jgi:hypothetical protein
MRRLQCPLAHDVACAGQQLRALKMLLALPSRLASRMFWEGRGILVVSCAGRRGADTDALSWNMLSAMRVKRWCKTELQMSQVDS